MYLSRLASVAFLSLYACSFSVSAGGKVDRERVEKSVAAELSKLGVADAVVVCPKLEENVDQECSVKTVEGVTFAVVVTNKDGKASWETKPGVGVGVRLADRIRETFNKEYGIQYDRVTCPPVVVADTAATCTAQSEGVTVPHEITFNGKTFDAKPTSGLLEIEKVENIIAAKVLEIEHATATVSCGDGPRMQISKVGKRLVCVASLDDASQMPFEVLVTDADGGINYKPLNP